MGVREPIAADPGTIPGSLLDAAVDDLAKRFRAALEPPDAAAVTLDRAELHARFAEPLPQRGQPLEGILEELESKSRDGLAGGTGGRYFGYVTGGALPAAAIVEAWTAAVDQNVGMWPLGPAAVELEQVTIGWLAELLAFPAESGYFGSGATMANTIALAVARHAFGKQHGVDVMQQGVRALPELAVYGSEELHLSDHKALRTLGLGSGCVRAIPIDERYAMRVDALVDAIRADRAAGIEPAIVIAQAGSVNTGACDPLAEIADVCREEGLWLHVDGAFGAFYGLWEPAAKLLAGMGRADSLAVDAHKWLNVPNGVGFVLLRNAQLHREAFAGSAAYLTPGAGANLHELGIEASRSWRGACVWAALKQLGREGVAEMVSRCCGLAQELATLVGESGRLELTAPAPTNVVCFRYRPEGWGDGEALDELNRRIQADVSGAGDVFHTGAQLANGFCQRAAIVSWRTVSADVRALRDAVEEAGSRLA
ncbi:MAG: aromatic-L-amino-acid/L-tryptophan decarboxylase [Gaiellales bacterium]|nr:aromatic-L-amino-acid/L-tryptophan decarboxylase [Gaiellales bacterium]